MTGKLVDLFGESSGVEMTRQFKHRKSQVDVILNLTQIQIV